MPTNYVLNNIIIQRIQNCIVYVCTSGVNTVIAFYLEFI